MSWITRLFRRKALERELDRELQFHLDAHAADLMRGGVSRDEALRIARRELGGVEQVKESARDARGTRWLEDWWQDTRFALRTLRRAPAFSSAAILTLAVGIGANTAVWSIVDALMLRRLPVDRPEELRAIRRAGIEETDYLISFPQFERLRASVPEAPVAAMGNTARMYATIDAQPEPVLTQLVSGGWFGLLGVQARHGRVLGVQDDRTLGGHPVAVLSEGFWKRRFGGDSTIVGKSIRVNGTPLTVIGVAQPGFVGLTVGQTIDAWVPLAMQHEVRYKGNSWSNNSDTEQPWLPQNGISWLTLIARVQTGAVTEVTARLGRQFRIELEQMEAGSDSAARAYRLREHLVLDPLDKGFSPLRTEFGDPLLALMASVGVVLLICCGNLASLLLARSATRTHEISVRVSLGARPGRLLRQTLTESLTLGMLGAAASLFVAQAGSAALLRAASGGPRAIPLAISLDARMLAFTAAMALLTSILFGLAPALRVARTNLYDSFRSAGRVIGASTRRVALERLLVIAQIALSLVLVTSAGLFVRTLQNLLSIDSGYDRQLIIAARLDARAAGYTYEALPGLYERLLEAARSVPGVRSASLSLSGLASGSRRVSSFSVPGRELPPGEKSAQENYVTADYFTTSGIPLTRGRPFGPNDRAGGPRVAIVSESMAKHFFGTLDVIGARFGYDTASEFEVVGVMRDARVNELRETSERLVFFPLAQGPQEYVNSLEVRAERAPESVIPALKRAISAIDPNLPVREVVTVSELVERGFTRERLVARLVSSFGILALLLAGLGLYGVMAYSVSRRLNEFGVRIALGAAPGMVSRLVLRETLQLVVPGLILGLALSFPVLSLTRGLVYGLSPHDPVTVFAATGILLLVALTAALIPAWRASRVDPIDAIRSE